MVKKKGLGRGLDAVFFQSEKDKNPSAEINFDKVAGKIVTVPTDHISPNENQPRTSIKPETIQELAASIAHYGLIQPITVRPLSADRFEIIAGERRWRAFQALQKHAIPCFIVDRSHQKVSVLELALIENIQREDLNAIEIGICYQKLLETSHETVAILAKKIGKDRGDISNHMRLLSLPPIIQHGIRDRLISMGHGRAILSLQEEPQQIALYEKIIKEKLSVRATEAWVKVLKSTPVKKASRVPVKYKAPIERLSETLETKINIQAQRNGKGKILIHFSSDEDFERILKHIQTQKDAPPL